VTDETTIIDRIDRRIVDELQQNARISWRELGDRVHLAPSSVADRVRRLEERG
jgi:Lrp/AsnC family leucine-responsive transcriptional regulator